MQTAHDRKQKKLDSIPACIINRFRKLDKYANRLGWRERGEMYCASLMVEGFGQEDPAKVRDEVIMEL